MELTKRDKRIAREIISRGIEKDFVKALSQASAIVKAWEANSITNDDAYHELYKHVKEYDKLIARRYDGLKNSFLLFVLAEQLGDGLISDDDLSDLSDEVKQALRVLTG